ncbi:MAG: alanine racemase [Parcubacteria group bacterium Gr01-1014_73]|nr:MAG: alanine racemase [Parcubacteria group bacterium Gr01-1014_73]
MKNARNGLRTWIEVDCLAIEKNYKLFRSLIVPKTKLLAVVKSNAYGHGLVDFTKELERLGVDWFGVDSIVEGLALRREGIKTPILVLGYTLPDKFKEAAAHNISLTVSSFETLKVLQKSHFSKPLKIHIKVDTGMHRQGFLLKDLPKVLKSKVKPEGLYTHFAMAKNPAFPEYTKKQIAEFEKWRTAFKKIGLSPVCHAAATAGTMIFPEAHFDMVRIGIGLYGLWPAKEIELYFASRLTLTPVLSWKTIISEIKKLPKGAKIGYDCVETLQKDSRVAICPIGYWHGYPRALSGIGFVLIHGRRAKILGRVSMDMIAVDVSDITAAKVSDEVVLIGPQEKEKITVNELANLSDTSHYEFVTRLNPLIKRIYLC